MNNFAQTQGRKTRTLPPSAKMTESCIGDCYRKLVQIQKDLRQTKNGPTKASVASKLDSVVSFLKKFVEDALEPKADFLPLPEPSKSIVSIATKKTSPKKSPEKPDSQLLNVSKKAEEQSPDIPSAKKATGIYPRLSDIYEHQSLTEEKLAVTSSNADPKLFSNNSYKHELSRKERLVNEFKRSSKFISNRQTIALTDSHPHWKILHEFAPNAGIVQVGGLCIPSAAAGVHEVSEAKLIFPNATRVLLVIGSNDIAHSRSAHHDLHAYSSTWLPYFSRALSKVFPNASFKFLLPFASQVVPQTSIDILQQQIEMTFQSKAVLQSPFYAACDFNDTMHLNPSARNQFTKYVAKILTDGRLQRTSLHINNSQRQRIIPLMHMKVNMPSNPIPSYLPSQFTPNRNHEIVVPPTIQTPPNLQNASYLPPHHIPNQPRTYAQVAATTNAETNPTHEIISQLTSLLPKLIHVINKYQ